MKTDKNKTNLLDRVIEFFSPTIAYRRSVYRDLLKRSALYAAAKTDRLSGGWSPADGKPADIIAASNPAIRKRVRQLVRDFPYFQRAINVLCDYTVGDGIKFQSRVKNPNGEINSDIARIIEKEFSSWSKVCDITGKNNFDELCRLAKRQEIECGEFFIIKRYVNDNKHPCPLRLQIIEPDSISSTDTSYTDGILHDQYGLPIAYGYSESGLSSNQFILANNAKRVAADMVIHGFEQLRPGQVRGVSPFVTGIMLSHDLQEYMGAEIDAAKMAAKWLAIVETPDPVFSQGTLTTDGSKKLMELENGIIEYLRPGEKMTLSSNPRPGNNFDSFIRLILHMFAVSTGVPFEFLSGDYSGMNYSTIRTIRNDFKHSLLPIQDRHINQFCNPIFKAFMDASDAAGIFPFNFTEGIDYYASEWQPPGMDPVDHLKESKADIDMIAAGLKSPQEVARGRGIDLEFIYQEIQESKKLAEKYGLDFDYSTSNVDKASMLSGDESNV